MASPSKSDVKHAGKLLPPRLGLVFERARLFDMLDAWADYPAISVAAAPGAGKSTLIATWLQSRQRITLWLQIDTGDADAATFLKSLDVLLGRTVAEPIELPPFRADDLSDLAGWLRRRIRLFIPYLPANWALVFDNHQELPADSPLQVALAQAIGELPHGVQWIFISRERPPAAFSRAMASQQLIVLPAEYLRFDTDETMALTRLHGRPEAMAAALAAAQGWVGGMTLMLVGSPREASAPGLEARQRLFDYFAGEVLARMATDDRAALCAVAFLPSVTDELAVDLTGHADAPAMLERLASLSLFVDRRAGRPTVYVLHALFSEFLRKRFASANAPAELDRLRLRAAWLLIEAGLVDAGLQSMIEAGGWDEVVEVLQRTAPQYVADGRTLALIGRIDTLAPALRERLAYWRGFCALDTDPLTALRDLTRAHAASAADGDIDGELLAAAGAATALVSSGRLHELDRWIGVLDRHARRAMIPQSEDVEMRLVPGLLAAVVYRAPWHPMADSLALRAERLLHRQAAPGQQLLLGCLAFHLLWRGQLDRLDRIVLRIDALCARQLAAPATMMRWWGVGILVKTLLGQTSSAHEDAERALALVDAEPSVAAQRASVELLRMIVALAATDAAAARSSMRGAAQAMDPDNAVDRATYEQQLGILALLEDDRPTALRLMRASVASAKASGFPMREHIALIANALAAAHSGESCEAQHLLDEVFTHPFHAICHWHHWIAGNVATYAAMRRGDRGAALVHLRHAMAAAREFGYRHGPMLYCCGDMMGQVAALALEHGIEPDVARDLVMRKNLRAPPLADATWPWTIRVHALGSLTIERSDRPLPASRKESRRLLELVAVLAAFGEAAVPLDWLADELWPDADGDAARNALDNALHRLRKLLGGDDRILLRQGTLLLNPQRCWTDVRALEQLLQALDGCANDVAPTLVTAIRRLYRAPLLPAQVLAGVVARRKALHQRVQRVLRGAANRLAAAGMTTAAAEADAALESLPEL